MRHCTNVSGSVFSFQKIKSFMRKTAIIGRRGCWNKNSHSQTPNYMVAPLIKTFQLTFLTIGGHFKYKRLNSLKLGNGKLYTFRSTFKKRTDKYSNEEIYYKQHNSLLTLVFFNLLPHQIFYAQLFWISLIIQFLFLHENEN